jgi:DnaJ-class molecular chaperone
MNKFKITMSIEPASEFQEKLIRSGIEDIVEAVSKSYKGTHQKNKIKYAISEVSACSGTGIYDTFGSPDCSACDGKGKKSTTIAQKG